MQPLSNESYHVYTQWDIKIVTRTVSKTLRYCSRLISWYNCIYYAGRGSGNTRYLVTLERPGDLRFKCRKRDPKTSIQHYSNVHPDKRPIVSLYRQLWFLWFVMTKSLYLCQALWACTWPDTPIPNTVHWTITVKTEALFWYRPCYLVHTDLLYTSKHFPRYMGNIYITRTCIKMWLKPNS